MKTLLERFMDKVIPEPNTGCWLWDGNRNEKGYGLFKLKGKQTKAHRVSFELFCEEIPENLHIMHKCDNPSCVNPDHLKSGTHQDNMKDKKDKKRGRSGRKIYGDTVKEIIEGILTNAEIAKKYSISSRSVTRIRSQQSV